MEGERTYRCCLPEFTGVKGAIFPSDYLKNRLQRAFSIDNVG